MYQLLFRNWKLALVWALGVSISVGLFFAEGGRHEELESNVEKIRAGRGQSAPAPTPGPAAAAAVNPPASDEEVVGEAEAEAEAGAEAEEDAGWAKSPA